MRKLTMRGIQILAIVLSVCSTGFLLYYIRQKVLETGEALKYEPEKISIFRELFQDYGCETKAEFDRFLDKHTYQGWEYQIVNGTVARVPVTRYADEAAVANERYNTYMDNILYYGYHDPEGVMGIDPALLALLIVLPILLIAAYSIARAVYDRRENDSLHREFLLGGVPNGGIPHSGMGKYSASLGSDGQLSASDYLAVAEEYAKLKRRCYADGDDRRRFRSVKGHVDALLKIGRRRYPLSNMLRRIGNAFIVVGLATCAVAAVLDFLTMVPGMTEFVFSDLEHVISHYFYYPDYLPYVWAIFLVPTGLVLRMASHILSQLRDDDCRYRLTLKYMVQEYTDDEMKEVRRLIESHTAEDLVLCPRPEVSGDAAE